MYKNGQAGVTKATVSITFDNSDPKQSPLGYEQYEEITITRQVTVPCNNNRAQEGIFYNIYVFENSIYYEKFIMKNGRCTI